MKKLFSILFLMFLIGCQTQPPQKPTFIKKSNDIQKINEKVKKAFDNAKDLEEKHSKWYDRDEKLPLTIIAVAYIDPEIKNRPEFYAYKKLIKAIQNNPNLLPDDLKKLYSSIKFIDYDKSNLAGEKFNAAYTHRYDDKEVLSDILRPDNEHPSQELLIRLNYNELKKGNLVIEGYKTVKQKNKLRNSYYFTLRYPNYSKLSKKDKNNVIVNSLFVVLSLSIPEYVSIDMSKIIDKNKVIRILKPTPTKGIYQGEVWKYEVKNEIDKLQKKIKWIIENEKVPNKVLKGHTSGVSSVAISPDGKYALSGSDDKTLRYWDLKTGKTIKVLKGHTSGVSSVAFSPDGKYALSGSDDKTLRYWDLRTGKTIKVLYGYTWGVNSVAISPDGRYALSGSDDSTLRYWDLKTGKTIKVLKGHTDWVRSVVITPDGRYALSGSYYGTLRYWDLKTGKTIKILKGHKGPITSVAISPDGKYALSGSRDNTLRYWDLKTGKTIKILKVRQNDIYSVAISPDGKFALSGGYETIRCWNLKTGETLKVLKGHTDSVNSVTFSPDGRYALSASKDKTIRYWKLKNKTIILLEKQIQKIKKLAALREHKLMLTILTTPFKESDLNILYGYRYLDSKALNVKNISKISNILNYDFPNPILTMALPAYKDNINENIRYYKNKAVLIPYKKEYDLDNLYFTSKFNYQEIGYKNIYKKTLTLMENKNLKGHTDSINSVAFSPDGKYALSGSDDKTLRYWDLRTGETLKVLKGHKDAVFSIAISPDGKFVLSGSYGTIRYWDLKTGKTIKVLKGHAYYQLNSVAITPDGRYALSGSLDKTLRYWDLKTGKTIKVLKGHTSGVASVAISPDGKYALSGSYDNTLRYWNLKTGKTIKVLKGHTGWVCSVAFSPDGKYALSGSRDNTLRYWDLKTGKTIKVLKGHTWSVNSVAISRDGRYALSGSGDGTLRYWNLKIGKTIAVLKGHTKLVSSVAFSPDGKYALSGSKDKTLRYWNLGLEGFLNIK